MFGMAVVVLKSFGGYDYMSFEYERWTDSGC